MVTLVWAMKNHKTNSLETPAIKNHKTNSLETSAIESHSDTTQGLTHAPTISQLPLFYLSLVRLYCLVSVSMKVPRLTSSFAIWNIFR